ncbi:MAG: hypothetical protein KDD10_30330 [Phaeodactylibacter sp.]|nr:hypothetical protein [Phaeodactylibacter sp.]
MKNWNWKKILQYIAMILGAIGGGAVGGTAYEAATDAPPPAEYSAAPGDAWTVTAWFIAEKKAGGGAVPEVRYTDNLGRYTVRVQSRNRPTDGQVIAAFDKSLDPARVTLEIVEIRKPEGIQEPVPDGPELD